MQNQQSDKSNAINDGNPKKKKALKEKLRTELEKTGEFREPDAKSGISGVSTTAFLSSALLTAIGFGIRDGFFRKYTLDSIISGIFMFFLNFLLALLLIVSGVVIFQTIQDSKAPGRNLKIYWIVLVLSVVGLIALK